MRLEVLVEEASAEPVVHSVLRQLAPTPNVGVRVFQGKRDLMKNLPARLRGYANWMRSADVRVVVLIDEDRQDCHVLKQEMDALAQQVGLVTKSHSSHGGSFSVVNRIAVEELEAWFFGDPAAVRAAFPRVSGTFERRASLRHPDSIRGGTAEAFERVLREGGYHLSGVRKLAAAETIAAHLNVRSNASPSFNCFVEGIEALCSQASY